MANRVSRSNHFCLLNDNHDELCAKSVHASELAIIADRPAPPNTTQPGQVYLKASQVAWAGDSHKDLNIFLIYLFQSDCLCCRVAGQSFVHRTTAVDYPALMPPISFDYVYMRKMMMKLLIKYNFQQNLIFEPKQENAGYLLSILLPPPGQENVLGFVCEKVPEKLLLFFVLPGVVSISSRTTTHSHLFGVYDAPALVDPTASTHHAAPHSTWIQRRK